MHRVLSKLQKTKVAIYGLTTEGYSLASKIADRASVTIVDDTLQMAMDLDPQTVRGHATLQDLVGGESLMGLKPIPQVLSEARIIFFAPKLRRTGDQSMIESSTKIREVAKHVSKGTTLINTLPVGIGGNKDNMALIEKQTGLSVGHTVNYGYCPLSPRGEAGPVATFSKMSEYTGAEDLGMKETYGNIMSTELRYISTVLNETGAIATEVELMEKARREKVQSASGASEKYIDDLASRIYDLTVIQSSEDVGEPLTYLAVAAVKSLENYVRYIVDECRELLRDMQLKASRTKVLVAWGIDKYEMRADRSVTSENLVERLRDYVTDVKHVHATATRSDEMIDAYKHNIAIACSASDYSWMRGLRNGTRSGELSILRATPTLQRG